MESIRTIILQRKKQLYAFNQLVNITFDNTKVFRLGNGEKIEFEVASSNHHIKATSCFGDSEMDLNLNLENIKKIEVSFKMSKSEKLKRIIFIICTLILTILSSTYQNLNYALIIFLPIALLIFRNKNHLSIKKM